MKRQSASFSFENFSLGQIKKWMLNWSQQFSIHLFLDSHSYRITAGSYECMLAAGAMWKASGNDSGLKEIAEYQKASADWLFGHINYDYKNTLEAGLKTTKPAVYGFPEVFFFQPETVLYIERDKNYLVIESYIDPHLVFKQIVGCQYPLDVLPQVRFEPHITREKYINNVQKLREHIARGDCYEINYCIAGTTECANLNPLSAYHRLNELSSAPFSALYRINDLWCMCASPERYIMRKGRTVTSQPIKGTASRHSDPEQDSINARNLRSSIKEQAENVMIVDLVRNDLARNCETGSVKVDELFGIYSFPRVHQMISTVSGTLKLHSTVDAIIGSSFPMGSMTGAPKYKVMQLADQYEDTARELYSGSIGYIEPGGDFDFNVVIRSLFYNKERKVLGYQAGGAITFDSNPEAEWQEVQLKAWAMENVFAGNL